MLPLAGTIKIKIPEKVIKISGKTNRVSVIKTTTKTGRLKNGIIQFITDNNNDISVTNKGTMKDSSAKARKELGRKLETELKSKGL